MTAFIPRPRTEQIVMYVPSFHPHGDCPCRQRVIHTGRFQGGSETCGRCGKLIGKHEFHAPERRARR